VALGNTQIKRNDQFIIKSAIFKEELKMKITNTLPINWEDLQNRVCLLLNQAGYFATSPKTIDTARGKVEVDVYATSESELIKQFICECKFWNTPVPKEKVHAFRTVVNDSGSMLGIFISKSGYQSGAYEAAYCSNVLLKNWEGFIKLIEKQWIANQTVKIKRIAQPLSVYTDPLDIPLDKLSEEERAMYAEITQSCLEAYMVCHSLNRERYLEDNIVVNNKSFTALDELFAYFEEIFSYEIMKYEKLFKNNPVEKWKFEEWKYMLVSNLSDF